MSELDPELRQAVRRYFEQLEDQVLERLEKGEEEYAGRWKRMTPERLRLEAHEEFLDMLAYAAMLEARGQWLWSFGR